jgi:hypothetical protein
VTFHYHYVLIVLVHISHSLRYIDSFPETWNDLASSEVFKHIENKYRYSEHEMNVFTEFILVYHHYILALIKVLCLLE